MAPPDVQPADAGPHPIELGGWRLVELLGRGGMGEVWRVEREGPGGIRRRGALKRVLPRLANDPGLRARFLAEARTNSRLEHPNIVQVLDFGDRPEPYLVLEYVEGSTAADLLQVFARSRTRLPAIAAAFIVAEVATGLHYAHRKKDESGRPLNIVHRDVSPQNVLISIEGAVKIGDFGVARAADNEFRTQEGVSVGKLVYMSPEQVAGQPFDARADVFALGVLLWELLTIQPLLARDDAQRALQQLLRCDFRAPSQLDARLPASVDALVMPALSLDPTRRYPSAAAFAQAARTFVHGMAPGFDSTELVRILGRLVPGVAFQSPTPAPRNAPAPRAPSPATRATPQPAVPAAPPQPAPPRVAMAPQPAPRFSPVPYAPTRAAPVVRRSGHGRTVMIIAGIGALAVVVGGVATHEILQYSQKDVVPPGPPAVASLPVAAALDAALEAGAIDAAAAPDPMAAGSPEATARAQLTFLREPVRSCLRLEDPGHVVSLDVVYDGADASVRTTTTLDGHVTSGRVASCIDTLVRGAVRLGTLPQTVSVRQVWRY